VRGQCVAPIVFREGAENCARGGRAPHFNFGFGVKLRDKSNPFSPGSYRKFDSMRFIYRNICLCPCCQVARRFARPI